MKSRILAQLDQSGEAGDTAETVKSLPTFWRSWCRSVMAKSLESACRKYAGHNLAVLKSIDAALAAVEMSDKTRSLISYALGCTELKEFATLLGVPQPDEFGLPFWLDSAQNATDNACRLLFLACHFAAPADLWKIEERVPGTQQEASTLLAETLWSIGAFDAAIDATHASLSALVGCRNSELRSTCDVPFWELSLKLCSMLIEHGRAAEAQVIAADLLQINAADRNAATEFGAINSLSDVLGSLPAETRAKALVGFASASLHVDASVIASRILLGGIGVIDHDFAGLGYDLIPNQRENPSPADCAARANWLWIQSVLGAPESAKEQHVEMPAGLFSLLRSQVQRWATMPLLSQRAAESERTRQVALQLSELPPDLRFEYVATVLECLESAGRFFDFGYVSSSVFWPHANKDNGQSFTSYVATLPIDESIRTRLLCAMVRFNTREPGKKLATALLSPCFDVQASEPGSLDQYTVVPAIERMYAMGQSLAYTFVSDAAAALRSEGRVFEAGTVVHTLLQRDRAAFAKKTLPRLYWCLYCRLGVDNCFFDDCRTQSVGEDLIALFGVSPGIGLTNTARKLFSCPLFRESGVAFAGDIVMTLVNILDLAGKPHDATELAQALVVELSMDFYSEFTRRRSADEPSDGFFALYPNQQISPSRLAKWAFVLARLKLPNSPADAAGAIELIVPWTRSGGSNQRTFKVAFLKMAAEWGGQPAIIFDGFELLARALAAQGYAEAAIEALKHPLHSIDRLSGLPRFPLFRQVLAPYRRLEFITTCIDVVPDNNADYIPLCRSAIDLVQALVYDEIGSSLDRRRFLEATRALRDTLAAKLTANAFEDFGGATIRPAEFLAWLEQLDNRILLEDCMAKRAIADRAESTHWPDIKPWNFGISESGNLADWGQRESLEDEYDVWKGTSHERIAAKTGLSIPCCLGFASEVRAANKRDVNEGVPPLSERARELFEHIRQPVRLESLVRDDSIWVRMIFGPDGRLYWWSWMKRDVQQPIVLLAKGASEAPDARNRLEFANLLFDAEVETIWMIVSQKWDASKWGEVEHSAAINHAMPRIHLEGDRSKRERISGMCTSAMKNLARLGLSNVATLGEEVLKTFCDEDASETARNRVLGAWLRVNNLLSELDPIKLGADGEVSAADAVKWKDYMLNEACRRHQEVVTRETNLSAMISSAQNQGVDLSRRHLKFTVEGPLHVAPLAWIVLGGRRLFEYFYSTGISVSLTLESLFRKPSVDCETKQFNRVLSAVWENPESRVNSRGLAYLHVGVHRVFSGHRGKDDESGNSWQVYGLIDSPLASPSGLESLLRRQEFQVVVIGGHGHLREAGVALATESPLLFPASDLDDGEDRNSVVSTEGSGSILWQGEGDFSDTDVIVLCSCAVGRLRQETSTDVSGLYTRIAANHGRSVIAARWPIDDRYAAEFVLEFLRFYREQRDTWTNGPSVVCTAFSIARKKMLERRGCAAMHLLSAFELYGE